MARVLKEGHLPEKEASCELCGAPVGYRPNEVQERNGTDYGGGPDGARWIVCPGCGGQIVLKRW